MLRKPLRLQIAIQGGGAKICSLLAAAKSVEEHVANGRIEIIRLAGTSAGAIVACLLAAEVPIGEVRQRLQDLGNEGLNRMFPKMTRIRMVKKFLFGEPFWKTDSLRNLLAEFFEKRGFATLGDINDRTGRHVFITATDITNERRIDYCHRTDPIVGSLVASCSMPYVFSAYKNCGDTSIVDGGICENLPIDALKEREDEWGQVIGISLFNPRPRMAPRNLKDFSLALLNSSINNSMMRAKESIGSKRVFQIETNIDTLEFERALGEGLGPDHYGRIKLEADKFFGTLAMVQQPEGDPQLLVGDPWQGDNVETMKKMGRIYRAQYEPVKLEYESVSLVVHANSLFSEGHPQYGLPDLIEQQIVFRPSNYPVHCHRLIVGSTTATDFPGRLSCTVRNAQGKKHDSEVIPSLTEDSTELATTPVPKIKRELLIFFNPPLPSGEDPEAPYTISLRDCLRGGMDDLHKKGVDFLGTGVLRAANPAGRVNLLLLVPEKYSRITMSPAGDSDLIGMPMNDEQLARFYVPHGFRALGWTCLDVPPEGFLRVKFVRHLEG